MKLGTRGPICFTCSQQSSTDDCDTVQLCGRNQMCKLEQISISDIVLWTTSCEDARTCQMLKNSAGLNCTSTCCASDLCNHECSATTTPEPTGCPQVQCMLDCGNPPKYVKDPKGCDLCQCDFGR
ncbi:uncharacterized protein LOC127859656 [Dreissena polymorpha]|uniref:uncharacterized protein LOC127859656 n=1 Tax=Dreissena polymorpha TaxID=45954 RepID=UPI0022641B68|nr:uncharacterized protein LOC127859656 [Dreissena polymorpha]